MCATEGDGGGPFSALLHYLPTLTIHRTSQISAPERGDRSGSGRLLALAAGPADASWLFMQVYLDGTTTMSTHERKANIREFYGWDQQGDDWRKKMVCSEGRRRRHEVEEIMRPVDA